MLCDMTADGDPSEHDVGGMFEALYDRLHALAQSMLGGERRDHTLEPAALLHEVYLRLRGAAQLDWRTSTHFESLAGRAMRNVLVDHARRASRQKRHNGMFKVTLNESLLAGAPAQPIDLLDLDAALRRLAERDPRAAEVLELRLFAAMPVRAVAEALSISYDAAKTDWLFARAWMARELSR